MDFDVLLIVITTAIIILIIIVAGNKLSEVDNDIEEKAAEAALKDLIKQSVITHRDVLYRKYKQTHFIDDYGRINSTGWDKEVDYFINNILKPDCKSYTGYEFSQFEIDRGSLENAINRSMLIMQREEINSGKKGTKTKKYAQKIRTGIDYENYIKEILQKDSFKVTKTPTTGDQGVDLIAAKNNIRIAIQCKFYSKSVGNKAVQEVIAGKDYYGCQYACVVSNNAFTPAAKKLASVSHVLLLNEDNIAEELDEIGYENNSDDEELFFTDLTSSDDLLKIK